MSETDKCEACDGTGWYGDNGPGIKGNGEFYRCECGTGEKCRIGAHPYTVIGGVAWCEKCNREACMEICRVHVAGNFSARCEVCGKPIRQPIDPTPRRYCGKVCVWEKDGKLTVDGFGDAVVFHIQGCDKSTRLPLVSRYCPNCGGKVVVK